MTRVALVGCGKAKRPGSHPARDLYTGPLFRAALAHAERTAERVFIVSALHELLPLDRVVESYNVTMPRNAGHWHVWAARTCTALLDVQLADAGRMTVAIYAGRAYADPLQTVLLAEPRVDRVLLPLDGLTQGARLAWFKQRRPKGTP